MFKNSPKSSAVAHRPSRTFYLVDIENINGGPIRTEAEARWCKNIIQSNLGIQAGEQVVVAVSHQEGLFPVHSVWPEARLLLQEGKDGADYALINVMVTENLSDRFTDLVVVSGDGIFADYVPALTSAEMVVTACAWSQGFSSRLKLAATNTVNIEDRIASVHSLRMAA